MKFSEEFIDRVREASNLVDVISQHVTLKRSGSGYQGLCPFHGEKTPSFSVSDVKQVYHCFGCKASGNVFKFIQDYQGLTFPETVEYLANRAGIPLPVAEEKWGGEEKQEERKTLYRINKFASEFYHQRLVRLPKNSEVWEYLKKRGFTDQDVEQFKLGWASAEWSELSDALQRKGAPLELSQKVGLSKLRNQGNGYFDLFRSRLIFPIFSPTEKCLGFGGRVIGDDHPKYLNSPDSDVFHKGQVFYGLNWSAKHLRTEDSAIIVEGYTDWIGLAKAGIGNVVATLGTALTERHAKLIKRYTSNVVVLFDGDQAGRSAAERSLPILLREGLYVKGLFLPDGMDPEEFVNKEGPKALIDRIAKAPDLFTLLLEEEMKHSGATPSDKTKLIEKMAPILEVVENASLQGLYIESMAYMLNVDKSVIPVQKRGPSLQKRDSAVPRHKSLPTSVGEEGHANSRPDQIISVGKAPRAEVELLNVSLLKSVYLEEVLKSSAIAQMESEGIKMIFKELERLYRQSPERFDSLPSLLSSKVEPAEIVTLHLTGPFQSLTDEAARKLIHDCIKRLREKFLRSQSRVLLNNIKGSQGLDQREKLEQLMNIQRDTKDYRQDQKQEIKNENKTEPNPSIQEPNANE